MTKTRSSSPQTLRAAWKRRSAAKSCSLNTDLFEEIYKSLKKKKPVIALMLVADAESAKLQYGVVTGLDVSNNRVTVALSEGVDTYTLAEFVAATRFENTKNIPLRLRFSVHFPATRRSF